MKTVAVIGAGVGGLATAIRLRKKGFQVNVFEANSYPGGKLTEIRSGDYRFDAGPSLFTMPEKVDELLEGNFEYEKLDEVCRYFYEDGVILKGYSDAKKFSRECENVLGVPRKLVEKHLQKSAFKYNATAHLFLEKSLHKIKSYLNKKTLVSLLKLPFLDTNRSMNRVNELGLNNPHLVQLFNRYATYNGSNPYKAPGILNLIAHLEFSKGAFFPKDGMIGITNGLFERAKKMGVNFKFNHPVSKVAYIGDQVHSLWVGEEKYHFDYLVSNMDIHPFFNKVGLELPSPSKILEQERSSSALIFYWGISKEFSNLKLHNIFFSKDYKKEFEEIFKEGKIGEDPTVYIHISSKLKKDDAPAGKENWFVMVNTPSNTGQDWNAMILKAKVAIIEKLSRLLKEDIGCLIETEKVLDPRKIESKTNSYRGSLYGTSSNSKMAAFFRHPNFSKEYKNLFFCGGSVHPGGGIPLALSSAKIVSEMINE